MTTLNSIRDAFRDPILLTTEKEVQLEIERRFTAAGLDFVREATVTGGVIDFRVGRIGIEVKLKGGKRNIYRQLYRYAIGDEIDSLILVTATAMNLPSTIEGKAVEIISLGRSWL